MGEEVPPDDENARLAWAWWAENEDGVGRLVSLLCRRWRVGPEARAAMTCEAAWRLPAIVASWRPEKGGSLSTHVFANLKWYLWKLRANSSAGQWGILHANPDAAAKRRGRSLDGVDAAQVDGSAAEEAREEVSYLMGRVDPFVQALLHLRHTCGMSLEAIGDALGVSKSVAGAQVARAERAFREARPTEESEEFVRELLRELRRP